MATKEVKDTLHFTLPGDDALGTFLEYYSPLRTLLNIAYMSRWEGKGKGRKDQEVRPSDQVPSSSRNMNLVPGNQVSCDDPRTSADTGPM